MNDRFLKACRREPVDRTPVWFMRQAGRYMPEYREIRSRHTLLDICRSPELATTVTMQPVETNETFGANVAVVSADITEGDLVVVSGQSRLLPGAKIRIAAADAADAGDAGDAKNGSER